jgi:hypothetical protein
MPFFPLEFVERSSKLYDPECLLVTLLTFFEDVKYTCMIVSNKVHLDAYVSNKVRQ